MQTAVTYLASHSAKVIEPILMVDVPIVLTKMRLGFASQIPAVIIVDAKQTMGCSEPAAWAAADLPHAWAYLKLLHGTHPGSGTTCMQGLHVLIV